MGELSRPAWHDADYAVVLVRPRRTVTIRTRLDLETVRERLSALAAEGEPAGWARFNAHGYFLDGGTVGADGFRLDYRFNNHKHPQVYAVHGTFQETEDWRLVRLELVAQSPWLSVWQLLAMAAGAASTAYFGPVPPIGALLFLGVAVGLAACANLLWVPSVSAGRAAAWLASELSGSFRVGDRWVVPK